MKKFTLSVLTLLWATFSFSQTVATFENLTLAPDTFWNGSDLSGGFASGNAYFANDYDTTYASWSGFTYSNRTDSTASGWTSQYNAITGKGYNSSANYAVADDYGNAKVRLTGSAAGKIVKGFYITNNTYAYYSMRDGDMFAKKFGGTTGTDADWFKVTALGWLNGVLKSVSAEFYLADFRSADSTQDYIVKTWQWFNLQPLGNVDSIQFYLSSSDTGQFGMNTPAYFCMDNFTTTDVPNAAPVAANDEYFITYAQDTAFAVLSNDFDTTATPLTVTVTAGPLITGAVATVGTDNRIYYTPATGISATDTVDYRVCDDAGLCATARVIVHIYGLTGIEETETASVKIYPNPFTNVLNIQVTEGQKAELFDASGQLFGAVNLQVTNTINTGDLATGVYFLKVSGAANTYTQRIIKH